MRPDMGIGEAVAAMKSGMRVARAGWNATGQSEGTVLKFLPYIMMRTAGGEFVPWLCSQTDLLAVDWETVG
jgi:hypothetical protein